MGSLAEIVGQDAALTRLAQALSTGRLPHAMLFVGPVGVGRRTTAEALAQTLLCQDPQAGRTPTAPLVPCGRCSSCLSGLAGTHADLHIIYKELARYHDDPQVRQGVMQGLSIGVIRQFVIDVAHRAAGGGRGKVFIVREAELLSRDAQNALLKTLEEPPPGVTIILLAATSEQMLPTTVSRCAVIRFGPLPEAFVTERLTAGGVAPAEAAFWARFTDGSLGEALRLSAAGLYAVKRELLEALAGGSEAELGSLLSAQAEALSTRYVKDAKADDGAELSKLLATRRAGAVLLRLLGRAVRDAMTLVVEADAQAANADQPRVIEAIARRLDAEALARMLGQLSAMERLLWRNVNPKTLWDNVAITCHSAAPLNLLL